MHLTVHVSLFYLLNICFNRYALANYKMHSKLYFGKKKNINQYSSPTEEVNVAIFLLFWPFIRFFASILVYKFMFRLATPVEVECIWEDNILQLPQLKRMCFSLLAKVSNLIFGWWFVYDLVLCDYLNLTDTTILHMKKLSHSLIFLRLTLWVYASLHFRGLSSATAKKMVRVFSFLVCDNFQMTEFQLAKFAVIAFVFFHVFPDSNVVKKHKIAVKVVSLVTAFSLIHASPLLLQWLNEDRSVNWRDIVNNNGIIVIRVFLFCLHLALLTIIIFTALKHLSPSNKYEFNRDFLKKMLISPVFFLIFLIDHGIWKLHGEQQQFDILINAVLLHLAALLASFFHLIKSLLSTQKESEVKKAMILILFIFISTIFILCLSTYTFLNNPLQFIIILFAIYDIVQVILIVLEYVLADVIFLNQNINVVKHIQVIDVVARSCFLLLVIAFMFQTILFQGFSLLIFMGSIYYAYVFFGQLRTYFSGVTEASQQELMHFKDKCAICREHIITSGCKTSCYHYYHQHCINAWLDKSSTCPMCSSTVVNAYKSY